MTKTIIKFLFITALVGGAMFTTSCDDFVSNIDNPVQPQPTNPDPENPDPQKPDPQNPDPENPDPQNPDPQNPDPQQPITEEMIAQAKQLLEDAQEDGAVVNISFTYNGKTYKATFKRENGQYVLQSALGDGLDATLQEVAGANAQAPDNFIFTIQDKTSGETLLQVFINTAEDCVEVKTVDENVTFSGVDVNGETVVMTPTDPSTGSETVFVTSATLDQTKLDLGISRTATLTCTIKPANATDKTISWTSSDKTIATVDENGKVTAIAKGTATITAEPKGQNPSFKIAAPTCIVTVNPVPVTSITLNKTSLEVKVDAAPVQLQATILPADATYKNVKWTTSNKSVATVDETGKVTFKNPGKATITVTATNGTDDTADDKTATCEVTVLGGLEDYNIDEEINW